MVGAAEDVGVYDVPQLGGKTKERYRGDRRHAI
jgi:hypothetical protein